MINSHPCISIFRHRELTRTRAPHLFFNTFRNIRRSTQIELTSLLKIFQFLFLDVVSKLSNILIITLLYIFWNMLSNNMLIINKTKIIIEILHNIIAICMQYFSKYCRNILFFRHKNIATILQQHFVKYCNLSK